MQKVEGLPLVNESVLAKVGRAVDSNSIRGRQCFVCGGAPTTGGGEHVFPKWLQKRFGLLDERLELINGTSIPYRNLTVPCCVECNTGFLSRLEIEVQALVERGSINTSEDRLALARWMSKILVGVLVKETSLLLDQKDPKLGNILTADFIREVFHCQLLLQSARKPTRFSALHGALPFTLYWYRIEGPEDGFDLSTDVLGQSVAMRMGNLGVAFVNDGGLQMIHGDKGPFGLEGVTVLPHQFSELAARVHTKASLRDATHVYLTSETPTHMTIDQHKVRPFRDTVVIGDEIQVFKPWNSLQFAVRAAQTTRLEQSVFIDVATGHEITTLTNLL